MQSLKRLIRAEMDERGLTYRAIAERATRSGYKLSHATVSNYASGQTRMYKRKSIEAIAVGLGVSPDKLLAAAEMPMLGEPFKLPAEAALLEPHERAAVRSVVDAFIQNRRRQTEEVSGYEKSAPMSPSSSDYDLAAYEGDEGIAPDQDLSGDP